MAAGFLETNGVHKIAMFVNMNASFIILSSFYKDLVNAESFDIFRMTGCKMPCSYNEYRFTTTNAEVMPKLYSNSTSGWVAFWSASTRTWTEEEILLYPFTSLIAEFGGALGLFLGFSFMAIWHEVREWYCR